MDRLVFSNKELAMEAFIPVGILVLCLAGAVACGALAYLLITLTKNLKETMAKVNPLIDEANEIVETLKPTMGKVDPIVDRVTLTIDAANLEIMRVDQLMEDLNVVTGNLAKASNSIDTITSTPLDVVAGVAGKIRNVVTPAGSGNSRVASAARVVDGGLSNIEDAVAVKQADLAVKKAANVEAAEARDAVQDDINAGGAALKQGVLSQIDSDTVAE
jgi:ABC-type transporter Mla subunit MlaD